MIFRAFDDFVSGVPAVFWSHASPADAAKQLAEPTERGGAAAQRIVADIDGMNVLLHSGAFILNPFAPIFDGELRAARTGSQLVGEFRRRKFMLLFCGVSYLILLPGIPFAFVLTALMSVWLGASVSWALVAGAVSALFLAGILFGVAIAMRIGMYVARRDSKNMSEHVDKVFQCDSAE